MHENDILKRGKNDRLGRDHVGPVKPIRDHFFRGGPFFQGGRELGTILFRKEGVLSRILSSAVVEGKDGEGKGGGR